MFRNFALSPKAGSDSSTEDDDPPPSPKSKSDADSPPNTTSSSTMYNPKGDRIDGLDCLVRKMSKQTLIRDQQRAQFGLSLESQNCEAAQPELSTNQVPTPQIRTSSHTIEHSLIQPAPGLEPGQMAQPIIDNHLNHLQPQLYNEEMIFRHDSAVAEDDPHLKVPGWTGPRREPGMRNRSASPNPRTLDLVANMIEEGAQCNVRGSGPPTPLSPNRPFSPADLATCILPDSSLNPMLDDDKMELEVDTDFCAQDGEAGPSEALTLRDAGAPAGVRKFGFLKYRSSLEAASRCKNMRKSVPRMRRRQKGHRPDSETSSNAASSTAATVL
ncbi:hypothetical protein GGR54DRAFT_506665 [Hypoxylon sp. NC1633]|nr:hypothetical protein GGR54DRAFT_506665 [Hypoxylon sp. NC1633]